MSVPFALLVLTVFRPRVGLAALGAMLAILLLVMGRPVAAVSAIVEPDGTVASVTVIDFTATKIKRAAAEAIARGRFLPGERSWQVMQPNVARSPKQPCVLSSPGYDLG